MHCIVDIMGFIFVSAISPLVHSFANTHIFCFLHAVFSALFPSPTTKQVRMHVDSHARVSVTSYNHTKTAHTNRHTHTRTHTRTHAHTHTYYVLTEFTELSMEPAVGVLMLSVGILEHAGECFYPRICRSLTSAKRMVRVLSFCWFIICVFGS